MPKLTYRNSQGQLVDLSAVAATKVKNEFGTILEKATQAGAVAITRHDTPKAVMLSYDEFVWLAKDRTPKLDDLSSEFDALLIRMQTAKARKGMAAAFNATSDQLGRAAVKAARRNHQPSSKRRRQKSRTHPLR
jgi:prevent-host-death family protein